MALTDAEQEELLLKVRQLHVAEFETTPEKVDAGTPRGRIFSRTDLWMKLMDHLKVPWK